MKQRIIAVHLLNDRSGSPLVFREALEALRSNNDIILYTATPSGDGFLTGIDGIEHRPIFYKWHSNKLITLFYFLLCQFILLVRLSAVLRKTDTVYINTLLPFGAALAAYSKGSRIVYHVHETSLKPPILKNFLFNVANRTAATIIFVSRYLASQYRFTKPHTEIIYNCLPQAFINGTSHISKGNNGSNFTVTMLSSFKDYKGVFHFINIARKMPDLRFMLILNTSQKEVNSLSLLTAPSDNCIIYPAQKDTTKFYEEASMVLNLSKPEGWVETFGMTILEAMHCGRPVICPPVGGVLELVTDGEEGFTIDSKDEDAICSAIKKLSSDTAFYHKMSEASYSKSLRFGRGEFEKHITAVFH